MTRLISRPAYSSTLGVDVAQLYKDCKTNHLKDAMVGNQIDADHPASQIYVAALLKKRGEDYTVNPFKDFPSTSDSESKEFFNFGDGLNSETQTSKRISSATKARENKKANSDSENTSVNNVPEHLEAYADMSLREVIMRHGTDVRFVDWLSALQKLESINEKRLKNEEKRDTLVSRELIENHLVSEFNECHAKIMTDGVKAIVNLVISKYESDIAPEIIERNVADTISTFINKAKKKIKKTLKKRRNV